MLKVSFVLLVSQHQSRYFLIRLQMCACTRARACMHTHTHTWMCLTIACHPPFLVGQLCRTAFYARRSTTIFCTSCLYTAWKHFPCQWNEHQGPTQWPSQGPDLTMCDFFSWCWAKEVYRSKSRTLEKLEQQIQDTFCCSSWLLKVEVLSLCLSACRSMCKMLVSMLKSDTKCYCLGFTIV